jgi:hypothetical protein
MLIEQAGFAIVRMTYANSLAFPFAVLVRLAGRAGVMRDDPLWLARPFGGLIRQGLGVEARILRAHDLPLGLSLVCLAEA